MASTKGTDKVLEKIQESLNNKNYYEAHQMYRTVCRRLIKQKQYDKAIDVLYSGAQSLLEHKQSGSGTDLSLYLIDAYLAEELSVNDESRDRIIKLLELFPHDEPGRKRFIDAAISWSIKTGDSPAGDPALHHYVAELLWKDKIYQEAEPHFLAGTSASSASYGKMLAEWSSQDDPSKRGAYLARAVLQYLCLRSIRDAKIAFDSFVAEILSKNPGLATDTVSYRPTLTGDSIEITIYDNAPLINFLQLLILMVQRDAPDLFTALRNKYKDCLAIEPSFEDLLNRIGEVFFNIQVQRPQQLSFLQDLMSSLFSQPGVPGGSRTSSSTIVGGTSSTSANIKANQSSELD
ncbi:6337_t:CDS:2 [Ambispora leptoticha]|uniref:6337_t:CDS:1 n=1 Tax=Ambispora leptoticha TaxID=144679 RepID=A0A9N9CGZ3_9GLOM|nr:6337_t:CDS:2 [Ambispora leptoticha]